MDENAGQTQIMPQLTNNVATAAQGTLNEKKPGEIERFAQCLITQSDLINLLTHKLSTISQLPIEERLEPPLANKQAGHVSTLIDMLAFHNTELEKLANAIIL